MQQLQLPAQMGAVAHELRAHRSMHVQRQQLPKTKKFYITRDVDITIQTLRNTTRVTPQTNEKVRAGGGSGG